MRGLPDFAYAQARLQSRFGQRAGQEVWVRLHAILDPAGYVAAAQQTPLRHWVLGVNVTNSSNAIELALRLKYQQHVDEVAEWLPSVWQRSIRWIKVLTILPSLQYLASGGEPQGWMSSDPDLEELTTDSVSQRHLLMRHKGMGTLLDCRQPESSMLPCWLDHWRRLQPETAAFQRGLQEFSKLLQNLHHQQITDETNVPLDYDKLSARISAFFHRHTFHPAGVFAYLALTALDVHRLRSALLRRLVFQHSEITVQ